MPLTLWEQFNDYAETADVKKQELLAMAVLHMILTWNLGDLHRNKLRLHAWLESPTPHRLKEDIDRIKEELAKEMDSAQKGRKSRRASSG